MKTYVYWNLHKHLWSRMVRGRVQGYAEACYLTNVEFRVRPAGRARVLREGRKNVHAFVVGTERSAKYLLNLYCNTRPVRVNYNPFKSDTFYHVATGEPVRGAAAVFMSDNRHVWAYGAY